MFANLLHVNNENYTYTKPKKNIMFMNFLHAVKSWSVEFKTKRALYATSQSSGFRISFHLLYISHCSNIHKKVIIRNMCTPLNVIHVVI